MPNKVIRRLNVFESEIAELAWKLEDGSVFYQRMTIPPKLVREAQVWAEEKVRERKAKANETIPETIPETTK